MEIRDKGKKAVILLATTGLGLFSAIGLARLSLKGRSREWDLKSIRSREAALQKEVGERLRCVECEYCKKRIYAPFFSKPVKHWVPLYCKKFRFSLSADVNIRCGAMLPEDAQREGR